MSTSGAGTAVALAGCGLAAGAALLPLRRAAFAAAVVVGALIWAGATLATGSDATRPLAAACVFLVVLLLRRERRARVAAARAAALAERERIARDLHDGLTHLLTGQLLVLETAVAAVADGDLGRAGERLRAGVGIARRALVEARDVVHVLGGHPPDAALVRSTVEEWAAATGRPAALDLPAHLPPLDGAAWGVVLATVREGLTNAARHGTGGVRVHLDADSAGVRVVVEDGGGRAPTGVPAGAGTGLQGLRERAALAGGTLTAGPTPTGWRVLLTVPAGRS